MLKQRSINALVVFSLLSSTQLSGQKRLSFSADKSLSTISRAESNSNTAGPSQIGEISNSVYSLISDRVIANRSAFYVYRDYGSGYNRGVPSGFFANRNETLRKIHVNPACVDDPDSPTGCAPAGSNRLDTQRGMVLSISFDALSSNEFVGVNIEEPEKWGEQRRGVGYDLRGATLLKFDIRNPTRESVVVQFGVAGGVTNFFRINPSREYIPLSFQLSSLNLADVHILFAVSTNYENSRNAVTVLFDNIRFEPVPTSYLTDPRSLSFPPEYQAFGAVSRGSEPFPPDQISQNLATTYGAALTLISLLARGTPDDLNNARYLADTLDYALRHDNRGNPLPLAADGSLGLHRAYGIGDIGLHNDQLAGAARTGNVRLAGFPCEITSTGFCLFLDGATGGECSFAILALLAAYKQFNDPRHLDDARIIGRWIVDKLIDTSTSGYGGYFIGFEDKTLPPKPLLPGKSVENNADIWRALTALAATEQRLGNAAEAVSWTARAKVAGDFVMRMFDSVAGRFYAGTVPAGATPNDGVCPNGPRMGNELINTCDFLDANTFATLALAAAPPYRNQIDWHRPMQFVLDNFAKSVTANGKEFRGFNIVESPASGPNGIAWEFTGQAVVALRFVDWLYNETRFEEAADFYLNQIRQTQTQAPFNDGRGIVAATLQDGDQLPPLNQCLNTPFQCIPTRVGLSAGNWAIFAERNINPLSFAGRNQSVSAANYSGASLASESIVAAFGNSLATTTQVAATVPLPLSLAGTSVRVVDSAGTSRLAPHFFVSVTQVNYLIPAGTMTGPATVTITSGDGSVTSGVTQIAPVAPGLFSANSNGEGVAAAVAQRVKADGSTSFEPVAIFDPAQNKFVAVSLDLGPEGDQLFLILFGTGLRNRSALSAVTAKIGGDDAEVFYAGAQGDFVGLDQINVRVPRSLRGRGEVGIALAVDGQPANIVQVNFK